MPGAVTRVALMVGHHDSSAAHGEYSDRCTFPSGEASPAAGAARAHPCARAALQCWVPPSDTPAHRLLCDLRLGSELADCCSCTDVPQHCSIFVLSWVPCATCLWVLQLRRLVCMSRCPYAVKADTTPGMSLQTIINMQTQIQVSVLLWCCTPNAHAPVCTSHQLLVTSSVKAALLSSPSVATQTTAQAVCMQLDARTLECDQHVYKGHISAAVLSPRAAASRSLYEPCHTCARVLTAK